MEASNTEKICKVSEQAQSTEKVSLGRQSEEEAAERCLAQGYEILARNLFLTGGEIDLLVKDSHRKRIVLIEVRSRKQSQFAPSRYLSHEKKRKLRFLASQMQRRFRLPVHIKLWERLKKAESWVWKEYVVD